MPAAVNRPPRQPRKPAATAGALGRVLRQNGRDCLVEDDRGEVWVCHLRRRLERVVCGDLVRWQPSGSGQGVIDSIEPRRNLLARADSAGRQRPLAANIDQVLVVVAVEPAPVEGLLDRYLVVSERLPARACILVNKADLATPTARADLEAGLAPYQALGYPVHWLSAHQGNGLEALRSELAGRSNILVGQSGVGKSSLTQALLPALQIRVGAISESTGLGRHTTTETTLYHLDPQNPTAGALIDSPGVRDFRPGPLGAAELAAGFREFQALQADCRFHNCCHLHEPGCAVLAALAAGRIQRRRWESYRQLVAQAERQGVEATP